MNSETYEEIATAWFGFANLLALIACFTSYKKWVQREKYPIKAHSPCFFSQGASTQPPFRWLMVVGYFFGSIFDI